LGYSYVVRQHGANVELYIDRGNEEVNRRIFETLMARRLEIESAFGGELNWQPLDGRRACRIASYLQAGGYKDEAGWPELQNEMIEAMIRLEAAFRPFVSTLSF
jgi:hypothetical protein